MSEREPSVHLLFSPRKHSIPPDSSSPKASSPDATGRPSTPGPSQVYVELPYLSVKEKEEYTGLGDRLILSGDEFEQGQIGSILGEYKEGSILYYYAPVCGGDAYRFAARIIRTKYPHLVEEYERKKEEGTLPPFDPSASNVHPSSRVKMILKLGKRSNQSRQTSHTDGSVEEIDLSSSSDDEFDGYSEPEIPLQSRTRRTSVNSKIRGKSNALPFSPRKLRTRRVYSSGQSDEDGSENAYRETRSSRKSTRTRKSARANLDDDDFMDGLEDDSDASVSLSRKSKAKEKAKREAPSRPAYGHFRTVADLDLDADDFLHAYRTVCEKCHQERADIMLKKASRKKGKKKSEDGDEDEYKKPTEYGGWVRCLKCPVAAHWSCLAKTQRDEILRAAHERDRAEWRATQAQADSSEDGVTHNPTAEPKRRVGLDAYSTTEFICGSCMKGGVCMMCREVALEPDTTTRPSGEAANNVPTPTRDIDSSGDATMTDSTGADIITPATKDEPQTESNELLFRCFTCKRLAHYAHLPLPEKVVPEEKYNAEDLAEHYQNFTGWRCADCVSYVYAVEHILAWRPFPENAAEPPRPAGEVPNYKTPLPREYLVKWVSRSYRRTQWVPHMWLVATHTSKLKNFLAGRLPIELLPEPISDDKVEAMAIDGSAGAFGVEEEENGGESRSKSETPLIIPSDALPDAERRIQPAWKTVDRVLDVLFWYPEKRLRESRRAMKGRGKSKRKPIRVDSDEDEDMLEEEAGADKEHRAAFETGEQPSNDLTESVEEWERRTKKRVTDDLADQVVWMFAKWNDLGYDDATWDSPPRAEEPGHGAYVKAFHRFVVSRSVHAPKHDKKWFVAFDDRPKDLFMKKHAFAPESLPQLGQNDQLKLMPFQVEGVNWLCNNWWNLQHCILADEMGLGKTVQIVTFLGVTIKQQDAFPALVVVPNSTLTNWVREFERWAPNLRVCSFYGDQKARDVIKNFELWHLGTNNPKFHVLVTTYETVTNKTEFGPVFKQIPRWEMLVVDEGQRLKSDSSHIFKRLKELNTIHRIILTGTPLNNNIRELFNLMNFLDPEKWKDLENLAKEHEVLTEESVKKLHARLRPYFLRRIKSEVLQLPPKNEVIVPLSMASLQKEVYRSILSQNVEVLKTLSGAASGAKVNAATKKTNMNNILMQLRKCLQHPYLVSRDIEPKGLPLVEAHGKLIDASAKLRMLKVLLPKLKARGHRVLLFSQFSMALDIVEDFLNGEALKYLRLDGSTKQADRQKGMDEFNKPGSDVFIYLLTTRAGGVGINLWSADTVIIFDPDYNPHQDLQAIARAHRYGQEKTVLVFKLMVKDSAEERIMQTGKKKLVLDHLIVQKMDDDESKEDVQSILLFGAKMLFEEGDNQSARDIHYSDHDIDNLIERTEKEGEQVEQQNGDDTLFSFAKVWAADKDALEEMEDEDTVDQADSWAQTLQRIAAERSKEQAQELTGRGVRRRAAAVFPKQTLDLGDTPTKKSKSKKKGKGKSKPAGSDESAYAESDAPSDGESTSNAASVIMDDLPPEIELKLPVSSSDRINGTSSHPQAPHPQAPLSPILNRSPPSTHINDQICSLCGSSHPEGTCYMTESAENLAEYRNILLSHAGDETFEERRAAIAIIDETLHKRGKLHLIIGQPLHLVETQAVQRSSQRPTYHSHAGPSTVKKPKTQLRPIPFPSHIQQDDYDTAFSNMVSRNGTSSTAIAPKPKPRPKPRPVPQAQPSPITFMNGVAGPSSGPASSSKRPLSPPRDSSHKKIKESASPYCVVCRRSVHLIKDCPVIQEGSRSTEREIRRLEKDPSQGQAVNILKNILVKQKNRESSAKRFGSRASEVILVDDD